MDHCTDYRGPDEVAYGVDSLALALSIRDSQAPVPVATQVSAWEPSPAAPSLKNSGIVGQILAAVCLALVIAFLVIVGLGQ